MVSDFKLLLKSSTLSYYIKSIDLGIKNKQKMKISKCLLLLLYLAYNLSNFERKEC